VWSFAVVASTKARSAQEGEQLGERAVRTERVLVIHGPSGQKDDMMPADQFEEDILRDIPKEPHALI